MPTTIGRNDRLKYLQEIIFSLAPVAICFSGGMDSTFLLWVCSKILPREKLMAVTFSSAATPAGELQRAVDTAVLLAAQHIIYPGPEMNSQEFLQNDLLRCYYCKRERFNFLLKETSIVADYRILDGSVVDDLQEYRPGQRALAEADVISPLLKAGISKQDIRSIAREHQLDFGNLLNESCLATRIKTGQPICEPVLNSIAAGENIMHQLGFQPVRVRWNDGEVRVEILPEELARALELRGSINESFAKCGMQVVSLDIRGYTSKGGANNLE